MNAKVDFVDPSTFDLSAYKLIVVPILYAAADGESERLNAFATCATTALVGGYRIELWTSCV